MTQTLLGQDDAQPILDLASQRLGEGWSIFTCAVPVESRITGLLGSSTAFDIGPLIQSVENLGWRLDQLDHVAVDKSPGHTEVRAQLLFRRVADRAS
ncbi:hypothetical protein C8046_13270 [Serinibacter arcticus]|uniref:Uncharacterized protein n=1 Tax=Serinibacter arcticus TaxID=1655435 RepID=A0A2U1ZX11_9MICO|nr:hypothetical protein [Serinibacter arcticus]PWD51480.1 hypothetical protein C8046_13270 [Serinibacter arcticus]